MSYCSNLNCNSSRNLGDVDECGREVRPLPKFLQKKIDKITAVAEQDIKKEIKGLKISDITNVIGGDLKPVKCKGLAVYDKTKANAISEFAPLAIGATIGLFGLGFLGGYFTAKK